MWRIIYWRWCSWLSQQQANFLGVGPGERRIKKRKCRQKASSSLKGMVVDQVRHPGCREKGDPVLSPKWTCPEGQPVQNGRMYVHRGEEILNLCLSGVLIGQSQAQAEICNQSQVGKSSAEKRNNKWRLWLMNLLAFLLNMNVSNGWGAFGEDRQSCGRQGDIGWHHELIGDTESRVRLN